MKSTRIKEQYFSEAYNDYSDAIFRFCFSKLSDREKAFDVTQEVFVRFWDFLRKNATSIDNTSAFLYKIARNLVIDEYRKRNTFSLDTLRDEGFDVRSDEHRSMTLRVEAREAVDAINQLEDVYSEVAILRFVEGLQPKEIALTLSISENAVSVRLNRAVKKLRVILNIEDEKK